MALQVKTLNNDTFEHRVVRSIANLLQSVIGHQVHCRTQVYQDPVEVNPVDVTLSIEVGCDQALQLEGLHQ